jgi:transcriptional regulator with XRE-family HTH domain/quercetin dioxygenase-like cupin family protein
MEQAASPVTASRSETTDGISEGAVRQLESMRRTLSERRRELGISMSELARRVGVSPSMISQIERGQSLPSVATLFSLANALGADVAALFDPPAEDGGPNGGSKPTRRAAAVRESGSGLRHEGQGSRSQLYVVRGDKRAQIDINGGVRWERLTPGSFDQLEFLELIYEPHAQSAEELYRHPGIEMVLVLAGRLEIHIGFEKYDLYPTDTITFPSSLPHRYVNPGDETARAVTAIIHDPIHELPSGNARPV